MAMNGLADGFDELLKINRLDLPEQLGKSFYNTNLVENSFPPEEDLCQNVKRWLNSYMAG
jgi:hypothetical protein